MDKQQFRPGVDRVLYTQAVYGQEEIDAVVKALQENWLGPSKYTEEFENNVAALFGKKYGLFVNSGTSANTLAMEIANLPKGSEVITQACTFPATLSPIVQQGYIPVFVDSKLGTYNIDLDLVEAAISDKTRAIFISHALGNVNDMQRLRDICDRHNLVFIEDACDTIGCTYADRPTGTFSDITTTSFYAAHNMTAAGGGGMLMVDDPLKIQEAKMFTDWGRASPTPADLDIQSRFSSHLEEDIDFDGKFNFVRRTYNFKGVEIQAAFGLEQLKKLSAFNAVRTKVFKQLCDFFSQYEEYFILPEVLPQAETYFIAFPLSLKQGVPFTRKELVIFLENNLIQTRPLFAGNILRHQAYKDINCRVFGTLHNSDYIMRNTFLIGCHHGMTDEMVGYMTGVFDQFLDSVRKRI